MSDLQEIANLLRDVADKVEAGDIVITGYRFDKTEESAVIDEFTLRFDNHTAVEWNRRFWSTHTSVPQTGAGENQ